MATVTAPAGDPAAPPAGPPPRASATGARRRTGLTGWAFTLPFTLLYLAFLAGPTLYNMVASLFDGSLVRDGLGSFVGLGNYTEALTDPQFWGAFANTAWFTVLSTLPLVVLAFAFAVLADRAGRGRWFLRLAFFAPYVLPSAVVAMIWKWMYADDIGIVPSALTSLGLDANSVLGDPDLAMLGVAVTTLWWTLGFNFILYLAGLQEIPAELHEAAAIDGAGPWQRIRHIVIPMLSRTTVLVAVLQTIASLKVFDQIYIMTSGGPDGATRPVLEFVYDTGFTDYRTGYASAAAVLFFLVVLAISLVWTGYNRRSAKRGGITQ